MSLSGKIKKAFWLFRNHDQALNALRREYDKWFLLDQDLSLIRNSDFYDEDYYLRNNIEVYKANDPAEHYLKFGGFQAKDPSEYFCSEEYLLLNQDVATAKINPLLHYEKHGRNEGREISTLQLKDVVFPDGTVETDQEFPISQTKYNRLAVVSCFFSDGHIPDTLLYLLKGLKEVSDNIILIGDCRIFPAELEKLNNLVCYAKFIRHQQYDFGSYKIGLEYARSSGLIDKLNVAELIMLNDSCYGPVYPFSESFDKMASDPCDFWGYSIYKLFRKHISSYFLVFRNSVIKNGYLDEFLQRVQGIYDRGRVIAKLETELTAFLQSKGMVWKTVCQNDSISFFNYPVTYLKQYRVPLVKKKAFSRASMEDLDEALAIIKENAPELGEMIHLKPFVPNDFRIPSIEDHQFSMNNKVQKLSEKVRASQKIKALFIISNCSMFPSKPLFDGMLNDSTFDAFVSVVPDLRWNSDMVLEISRQEHLLLSEGYHEDRLIQVRPDDLNQWPDICSDMDIVCYNTPYNLTSFRYLPKYSAGRDFLPIMVNYGYYRSKYDDKILALDSHRYMWKAFFECEETKQQYLDNTAGDGANAEIVGYIKMDSLANYPSNNHTGRKKILVALHHSVDGGANDILNLGNFIRYLDYFIDLPDRYPDIDFIYRPHPFLFATLRKPQFWGVDKVNEYIETMRSKSNVTWNDDENYFKVFAESDACIQDCGSFLVEYLYTKKPCCYMLKDPTDIDHKFAPLGKKCLEQCYISYDTNAIDSFIEDVVISGDDPKAESREEFCKHIMTNYPHAADVALKSIKESLGIG